MINIDIPKDKFKKASNKLLNKCFILKNIPDTHEDYLLVFSNQKTFAEYFSWLDYSLKIDESSGVIGLESDNNSTRIHLLQSESIILIILRMLYIEEKSKISLSNEIIVTIGDIQEKFLLINVKNKNYLDRIALRNALSRFERYNLISRKEFDVSDPETRIIIYPSITFAMTQSSINEIYDVAKDRFSKYKGVNHEDIDSD